MNAKAKYSYCRLRGFLKQKVLIVFLFFHDNLLLSIPGKRMYTSTG